MVWYGIMVIQYGRPASMGLGFPGSLPSCHLYTHFVILFLDG